MDQNLASVPTNFPSPPTIDDDPINGKHYFAFMCDLGDKKTLWSKDNPDEVESARREFKFLVGEKKYRAFTVKKDGEAGEIVTEFDPSMERIIFTQPLAGG